jgi:hypothetical protein
MVGVLLRSESRKFFRRIGSQRPKPGGVDRARVTFAVPEACRETWLIWRIVLSGKLNETYSNIAENWTIDEVLDARDLLDAIDEAIASAPKPEPPRKR